MPCSGSCRTIFVSDGGGGFKTDSDPAGDWLRHTARVLNVIDHQVRSLRKRQVVGGYTSHRRDGVYVGIRSDVSDYPVKDPLPVDPSVSLRLADVVTRLDAVPDDLQEQLINWGYVIADTGLRSWWPTKPQAAGGLPYPNRPLTAS